MSTQNGKERPGDRGGANRRRLTHAESLKRQQKIVLAHDVGHRTFAQIARQLGLGEKECREAYGRYVRDVAPLMSTFAADEAVTRHLRTLEEAMQQLRSIAAAADNDSARVGALRELVRTIFKDIELRQHLGMYPRPARHQTDAERLWIGQEILRVFEQYGVPTEAGAEIQVILATENPG